MRREHATRGIVLLQRRGSSPHARGTHFLEAINHNRRFNYQRAYNGEQTF
jgi:hypothetical protein